VIPKVRRTKILAREVDKVLRNELDTYLVYVATEDTYAVEQYLDALQEHAIIDRTRVKILVLPTTDTRSSLRALVDRLKQHVDALDERDDRDELWAVFDVDHQATGQHLRDFTEAVQVARTRGIRLAGSNPCFELWLLLHLTENVTGIPSSVEDRDAARACERRLRDTLLAEGPGARGYNKTRIGAERFAVLDRVRDACARARALSPAEEPWPSTVGTRVHALIDELPAPTAARGM
jgi:RloB-like protein